MNKDFFVLDTVFASNSSKYAGGQFINDPSFRCRDCAAIIRKEFPAFVEITLDHLGIDGFGEYLWNSHSLSIFREDLIYKWNELGYDRFITKPIKFQGWTKNKNKPLPSRMPNYFLVIPLDTVKLLRPKPLSLACTNCGKITYEFPKIGTHLENGLVIDCKTWNNYEIFGLAFYDSFIFGTQKFAKETLSAGFNQHISFINAEIYNTWDNFDFKKWTPSSYSKYLNGYLIRKPSEL